MFKRSQVFENCALIAKTAIIDNTCVLKGEVNVGEHSKIGSNCLLDAEKNTILIGNNVQIESNVFIISKGKNRHTFICNNTTIASGVRLINATLEEHVRLAEGAVIMDNAFIATNVYVGKNTIIAKDAIVMEGTVCEDNAIYAGIPAQKVDHMPTKASIRETINRFFKKKGSLS